MISIWDVADNGETPKDGNRAILWDHFLDVLCLLLMETGIFGFAELIGRSFPGLHSFLTASHRILVWFAIATVSQFAVCSFVLLTVRGFAQIRKAVKELRGGAT